jgi:hypothetical protein
MRPNPRKGNAGANESVNGKIKVNEKPMAPEEILALVNLVAAIGVQLWKLKDQVNFPKSRPPN